MPHQPDPIPLQNLIRNDDEKAVWQASFGAAFAHLAISFATTLQVQDDPPGYAAHLESAYLIMGLDESTHPPRETASVQAQLIAQAAVLQYRRIAS